MNTLIAKRFRMIPDKLLGQGGMGTVYLGEDSYTGESVAIKRLRPEVISRSADALERFKLEGETLRKLNHPNIVKMLGADEVEEHQCLVMEYVGGGSLRGLLEKEQPISIQRVLYIALDLADALTRAHRLDILHRDIKPENILIADDGTPRLTDFGMALVSKAHITQSGAIVGTIPYLSPESFNNEEPDERTDIWAFGIVLFEMLTGKLPFNGNGVAGLVNAIITRPVPNLETLRPDLPLALIDLVHRMLEKDRRARIPSVRLIGAELEAIIRGDSLPERPHIIPDTTGRFEMSSSVRVKLPDTAATPPNNLPLQPTSFIGREDEVMEVQRLLQTNDHRVVTLLGPGGIGKTRIAVEVGERLLGQFADGVYFVPLAPLDDSKYIVPNIAEHLRFMFGGEEDPRTELLGYLQEKQLLLILDNFEHLIDGVSFISDLTRSAPNVRILVTSRERLRLQGEQVFEIEGMRLPGAETPVTMLSSYPVIQLFLQSARRVVPDFELSAGNAEQISRICCLVQGLPLGIELAAAWLEHMSPQEIISEIEHNLDFLETDLRDVPDRHRSLRSVFDYSWNLLSDDEQATFMKLAVFRGGFDRNAALKITGSSLRTLTALVNKSLIQRDPSGRYRLNRLLRQYAEDNLNTTADPEAVRKSHALYYADFVRQLEPTMITRRAFTAFQAIDEEFDNIHAGWQWAIQNSYWEVIDHLVHPMMGFYQARSRLREAVETFGALCNALETAGLGKSDLFWRTRLRQRWLGARLGAFQEAVTDGHHAYDHFAENDLEQNYALNTIGYGLMMQGEYEEAIRYISLAVELARTHIYTEYWFTSMANLGYAEYLAGNLVKARQIYESLNSIGREREFSPIGQAFSLNNLGEILREMGEPAQARDLFQESHEIFKSYNARRGMAFTLNNWAGIDFILANYDEARARYEEAYRLNKEIGDLSGISHSLSALGNAAAAAGELEAARVYYQESLDIRRKIGSQRGIADSLVDLARVAMTLGEYTSAFDLHQQSLNIRREMRDRRGEAAALAGKGLALLMAGNRTDALILFDHALKIATEVDDAWILSEVYLGLGEIALEEHDYDTAAKNFYNSLKIASQGRFMALMLFCLTSLACIEWAREHWEQAFLINTIVLNHPGVKNFIPITFERASELNDIITDSLPDNIQRLIIERSQHWTVDAITKSILQNAGAVTDNLVN